MGIIATQSRLPPWVVRSLLLPMAWLWPAYVAAQATQASATQASATLNPHWAKDACNACHQVRDGRPLPVPPKSVSALCISCHDGRHAHDEAHPIDRPFNKKLDNPGWPLLDGNVQCLTCHDVRQQCDPAAETATLHPTFLRQGPATGGLPPPFFANCHRPDQEPKFNPHLMLTSRAAADPGSLPNLPQQNDGPEDGTAPAKPCSAMTRSSSAAVVIPRTGTFPRTGHVFTAIKPEMLAYMRARELTGLVVMPSPELMKQLRERKPGPR